MNCLLGLPVPQMVRAEPFSVGGRESKSMSIRATSVHHSYPAEQLVEQIGGESPQNNPTLSQKAISSPAALTFGQVDLVDEPWQDVAILNVEVVMWSKDVGGDDGSEAAAVLLKVAPG